METVIVETVNRFLMQIKHAFRGAAKSARPRKYHWNTSNSAIPPGNRRAYREESAHTIPIG